MPRQKMGSYSIETLSILGEDGSVADENLVPALSSSQLRKIFEEMLTIREFDERGIALQRQGRMGTFAPTTGQEAVQIGAAAALQAGDWVAPSFREQGVYLARGVKPSTLFMFFMGTEEGNRLPRRLRTLPVCVPCATQMTHAVGIAMAAKLKKDPVAVAAFFGEGATSEGDFHEAMNFAGVYQTPNVFICQNNQWAISTPRAIQTHSETIAQKAIAYDIRGIQLDGNDVLAVYAATQEALNRARTLGGPSLLECLTYRMGIHTTSDDPSRYRSADETLPWRKKDPIDRFEKYLLDRGILREGERERMTETIEERLKAEVVLAEELTQNLSPDEMFTYMYAQMPEFLRGQMAEALQERNDSAKNGRAHG
jgi:pyruvate dehydrogenase E1 component alpha subunit